MHVQVHDQMREKMEKTIAVLKDDLHTVRAGRANPQLLDHVSVEYYGSQTPLKQLAAVSAPEPRLLVIQPYDATIMSEIEKAIMASDIGITPSNDGKIIRLAIPMLTEERRKDLTKVVKKYGEDAKVALRHERRDANDKLKKMNKSNELTEDDLKRAEDEVQKTTDKFVQKVDEIIANKEKEILEV